MDSADKIEVFKSFEELTQKIIQERDTNEMLAQRYAVRFIADARGDSPPDRQGED